MEPAYESAAFAVPTSNPVAPCPPSSFAACLVQLIRDRLEVRLTLIPSGLLALSKIYNWQRIPRDPEPEKRATDKLS
jgi:hypothetical protein